MLKRIFENRNTNTNSFNAFTPEASELRANKPFYKRDQKRIKEYLTMNNQKPMNQEEQRKLKRFFIEYTMSKKPAFLISYVVNSYRNRLPSSLDNRQKELYLNRKLNLRTI